MKFNQSQINEFSQEILNSGLSYPDMIQMINEELSHLDNIKDSFRFILHQIPSDDIEEFSNLIHQSLKSNFPQEFQDEEKSQKSESSPKKSQNRNHKIIKDLKIQLGYRIPLNRGSKDWDDERLSHHLSFWMIFGKNKRDGIKESPKKIISRIDSFGDNIGFLFNELGISLDSY